MRVASVPNGHVYVRHLSPLDGPDAVRRLPDPRPARAATSQQWWPPVMLDPDWVDAHADEFDLFHLHFGFDAVEPQVLQALVGRLHAHDKPIVYTVHDLRNPHQPDPAAHDAALDVLVPGADALITLTEGAADEVERRWGRRPQVIAHPHVVPLDRMAQQPPAGPRGRVIMHCKSLRPNLDPLPMLDLLVDQVPARGLELLVDVHTDVMTPGNRNHHPEVASALTRADGRPGVSVHVHDYYDDDELWDYFAGADLSVLPYRFGTHSGWLEACYDLGTRVLAPRIGHYHDQHPGVLGYRVTDQGPDAGDVTAALDALVGAQPWRAEVSWRREQRNQIAAEHERLYLGLR